MQPTMLVDYLDCSRFSEKLLFMTALAEVARSIKIEIIKYEKDTDQFSYDVSYDKEKLEESFIRFGQLVTDYGPKDLLVDNESITDIFKQCVDMIRKDSVSRAFVICYKLYIDLGSHNYLVTKDLSTAFKTSRFILKGKHLKENQAGYIEFRDQGLMYYGEKVLGTLFSVRKFEGMKVISISVVTSTGANCYCSMSIGEDESIMKSYNEKMDYDNTERVIENKGAYSNFYSVKGEKGQDEEFVRIVLSTIIYIGGKNSDLTFECNEFSRKKSKYETQVKMFTRKNYCLVGKGFVCKTDKEYIDGLVPVVGHYKFVEIGSRGEGHYEYRWWSSTVRKQKVKV